MQNLIEQLSRLAERDDTEGLVMLLEEWQQRDDDWVDAVEARLRAPSSTATQKARLRALLKSQTADNNGSELTKIRSSLGIVKKLISLEGEGADWSSVELSSWLASIETIDLSLERLPRLPDILWRLPNLRKLEVVMVRLPRGVPLLPDAITGLSQLKYLDVSGNRLTALPKLPARLTMLIASNNPKLQLDLSGMAALEELYINGVNSTPRGIADLQALRKLGWQDSTVAEFPAEFLTLPQLQRANIDLENSDMELPEVAEMVAAPLEIGGDVASDEDLALIAPAVHRFNAAIQDLYGDEEDGFYLRFYRLAACERATDAQIEALTDTFQVTLPPSLITFYRHVGGLGAQTNNETWSINVPTLSRLLAGANPEKAGGPLRSLGIIDQICWNWGNSRPEFDAGVNLSQAEIDELNAKYTCFGLWRHDWGLEAAFYLYVDDAGCYGSLYYHQDYGDVFDELRAMRNSSPATLTLGDLVDDVLGRMEAGIRDEWADEHG